MNSQQFTELRKATQLSQAEIAVELGLSSRTIANWEAADPPREFSRLETNGLRHFFLPRVLGRKLSELCDEAFETIPSELCAIWLVEEGECLLVPNAARFQDLETRHRRQLTTATCTAPLMDTSLTTEPLRSGKLINEAGPHITQHPAKRYRRTREAPFFRAGRCESLLHMPAFIPSSRGPRPVLLLSLENKLDPEGKVLYLPPTENECIPDPAFSTPLDPGDQRHENITIYSAQDEEVAAALANRFCEELRPHLELLDMLTPEESPSVSFS
ncbi:MAG: helix-turn-helix domain-containing protein [Armatimonadetes bacterium]|nr:helix-turn-helix domain-containing protein [Armatimonadota bacterium]